MDDRRFDDRACGMASGTAWRCRFRRIPASMQHGPWLVLAAVLALAALAPVRGDVQAQTISSSSFTEGNFGPQYVSMIIEGPFTRGDELTFATADGTATAADNDYVPYAGLRAVCPAAECISFGVHLEIIGDQTYEPDETVTIILEGVVTGTIIVTIVNDDPQPDPNGPIITPLLDPPAPNGTNGWYVGDVGVVWEVTDPDSAVTGTSGCDPATIVTDGVHTLTCEATSEGGTNWASVQIKRDATLPVFVHIGSPPLRNAAGWYNGQVVSVWGCGGGLSDVDGHAAILDPDPVTLADGADYAITLTCIDGAGNRGSVTEGGYNIDRTAPVLEAAVVPPANAAGWHTGPVTVTFTCTDATSGVAAVTDAPTTFADEGAGWAATGVCTDVADNRAELTVGDINIDLTAPTIAGSRNPAPNANGWSNQPVAVGFACDDAFSGVATCAGDMTLASEGADQAATGTATDRAGNSASTTVDGVAIDLTAPTITFLGLRPADGDATTAGAAQVSAAADRWHPGPVTAEWACADALAGPTAPVVAQSLSSEGVDQSLTGVCADLAGNASSDTVGGIRIDATAPVYAGVTDLVVQATSPDGAVVGIPFAATDARSGIATDTCLDQSGARYPIGTTEVTCTAADRVGHQTSVTFELTVQVQPVPTPTDTPDPTATPLPTETPVPTSPPAPSATSDPAETPDPSPTVASTATPTRPAAAEVSAPPAATGTARAIVQLPSAGAGSAGRGPLSGWPALWAALVAVAAVLTGGRRRGRRTGRN